ncbi:serine protease [Dactylosporangium matsuzakiense]|uniref:NACHT domain-containing protein n=1 Tax=Dactylosporangium matsuzakiense TaxID=53360 RepID=A0A9W6KJS9_9ACTN|nr:serine protease [Dactylosporangium matsuzakiense]GLL02272.1 hypothetical protein GCM10017581_040140 [Dactylosporangium matsuzakiense]
MDGSRIAQVRVTRDRTVHFGSGYRVTTGTVLTCAHVLADASAIDVLLDPGGPDERSVPARVPWRDDANDVAVLALDADASPLPGLAPCEYGRLPEQHAVLAVTAAGYPRWKRRDESGTVYRDLHVAAGQVDTLANRRSGRLEITVPPPLESPDPAISPWEGMSGAAVLAEDRVVGVVIEHHRAESARRLTAVRIERALHAAGARRAELAALLGLPDAADPPAIPPAAAADSLGDIAQEFAALVQAQLTQELERLQVYRPYPLPVQWQPESGGDIRATYRRTPSGRLVILGEPGSGKSVLALRLAQALLEQRRPADPVPVVFALRTWNPRTTDRRQWLAATLAEQYPALAAQSRWHHSVARELVNRDRVLPILDGLDEMAPDLRAAAAARLPDTGPVIVTSTPAAYRDAVHTAGPPSRTTEITVTGVAATELAHYLSSAGPGPWAPVVERLTGPEPAAAAVRDALHTPLAIALAREIYRIRDPAQLFTTAAAGGAAAVQRHLLNVFIPAVYAEPLHGAQLHMRRTSRPWHAGDDEDTAHIRRQVQTLARLAGHRRSRGAIAWWLLVATVPRRFRALVTGAVYGFAALTAALLAAQVYTWTGGDAGALHTGWPAAALTAMAAAIGAAQAARDTAVPAPVHTRLRIRGRVLRTLGMFILAALFTKTLLFPVKLAALATGHTDLLAVTVVLSWGIGIAFASTFVLRGLIEVPLDLRAVPSPPASLAASRRSLLLTAAIVLVSTGLGIGGILILAFHQARFGLMVAAFAAPIRLAVAVMSTAYGRFCLVTRPYFALTGRLPWRLLDFLDDALCRGVLRQSGPVHLFRNERLRQAALDDPILPRQHSRGQESHATR